MHWKQDFSTERSNPPTATQSRPTAWPVDFSAFAVWPLVPHVNFAWHAQAWAGVHQLAFQQACRQVQAADNRRLQFFCCN